MEIFKVENKKCTKCGLCAKECPLALIEIDSRCAFIKPDKIKACMKCQHCSAICPSGAISVDGFNPDDSLEIKNNFPEYSKLETLVKGRRSIRKFKQENVKKEILEKLLSDALHAPTAVNAMQVNFTVIDDIEILNKYKDKIYRKIKVSAENNSLPKGMEFFESIADKWINNKVDVVFRNAPHMIIATESKTCSSPSIDTVIALSYLDLLAPTMGLGTLWCGMAKWAIHDILPEMIKEFGIPEDHVIGYCMLLGKPNVKFKRTVQRPIAINTVK